MKSKITTKQLVVITGIFIAAIVAFVVFNSLGFKYVSTTPETNRVSVLSPYIDINFNKPLQADTIEISAGGGGADVVESFSVNDKTLRVMFEFLTLQVDGNYTLVIENIHSKSNDKIDELRINFTARDIGFDELSDEQKTAVLERQDTPSDLRDDPIFSHVPYGTLNFNLSATVLQQGDETDAPADVVLIAEILLSAADARSNRDEAIAVYKEEVLQYIRSLEIDPNNYVIDYRIIEPSLF